jgi:hypothetical protein
MPIIHLRDLAAYGVVSDVDPYNIPTNAFSSALNVRFDDGSVDRGIIYRSIDTTDNDEPRFVVTFTGPSDAEELIIGYKDGTLAQWTVGGSEVDTSISGYTPAESDGLFTACHLGGVLYVNRNDREPWDWKPGDTEFEVLANWDTGWRCNVLRSYNDCLVAFNITEDAASLPTGVRTSEIAEYGEVPTTWDETDPTNNATRNILAEMRGAIVEAQTLQSTMVIYTNLETWIMQADGSDTVYSYRRVFNDQGAMSANCAVELEGKHYVFGYRDIWVHDGVGKESISNSRVRKQVFTNLDYSLSHRCFVRANPVLSEIYFFYHDGAAAPENFFGVEGCNAAAVYNYKNNTWSFITAPNVYSGDSCVIGNPVTYEETTDTYDELSVSYFNLSEASKRVPVIVGDLSDTFGLVAKLYGMDLDGPQSILSFPSDEMATLNWYLEKDGCDLDELDLELRGYKNIVAIYPQARLSDDEQTIEFAFGSADYFGTNPLYTDYMSYDNSTLSKLDYKSGGRYLSFKLRGVDGGRKTFRLSGMDFDVEITGER